MNNWPKLDNNSSNSVNILWENSKNTHVFQVLFFDEDQLDNNDDDELNQEVNEQKLRIQKKIWNGTIQHLK